MSAAVTELVLSKLLSVSFEILVGKSRDFLIFAVAEKQNLSGNAGVHCLRYVQLLAKVRPRIRPDGKFDLLRAKLAAFGDARPRLIEQLA